MLEETIVFTRLTDTTETRFWMRMTRNNDVFTDNELLSVSVFTHTSLPTSTVDFFMGCLNSSGISHITPSRQNIKEGEQSQWCRNTPHMMRQSKDRVRSLSWFSSFYSPSIHQLILTWHSHINSLKLNMYAASKARIPLPAVNRL